MEIKSLDNLNLLQNGLYDLNATVFNTIDGVGIYTFICEERHAMRIDLICNDIYKSTKYADVVMLVNGIFNHLTIEAGDVIFYIEPKLIDNVVKSDNQIESIKQSISKANKGKTAKQDTSRISDKAVQRIKERDKSFIPPNILTATAQNVEITDSEIILKPNF